MKNRYNKEGQLNLMQGPPGPETIINGRKYLYFGGTSYFGLHDHHEVIEVSVQALKNYGLNSGTIRNGFGTTPLLLDLEKKAASFFNAENATCLPSGYLSTMAGLQALHHHSPFDVIFIDIYSHYSNFDGASATRKPMIAFNHLDPHNLEKKLKTNLKAGQRPLLITDGIFPVFGEIAPLPAYLEIILKYDGIIWVDDSHGTGVIGEKGRGSIEFHKIVSPRIFTGSTLSKAIGGFGGIIPGQNSFINALLKTPVLNGISSAPSPAIAASLKGLEILMEHPEMRQKLWNNVIRLKRGLRNIGFEINDTPVPIAAWSLKNKRDMKYVQQLLVEHGISIQHLHYTGAPKQGVLRAVVFSTHSETQIDRLIYELSNIV